MTGKETFRGCSNLFTPKHGRLFRQHGESGGAGMVIPWNFIDIEITRRDRASSHNDID